MARLMLAIEQMSGRLGLVMAFGLVVVGVMICVGAKRR